MTIKETTPEEYEILWEKVFNSFTEEKYDYFFKLGFNISRYIKPKEPMVLGNITIDKQKIFFDKDGDDIIIAVTDSNKTEAKYFIITHLKFLTDNFYQ